MLMPWKAVLKFLYPAAWPPHHFMIAKDRMHGNTPRLKGLQVFIDGFPLAVAGAKIHHIAQQEQRGWLTVQDIGKKKAGGCTVLIRLQQDSLYQHWRLRIGGKGNQIRIVVQ